MALKSSEVQFTTSGHFLRYLGGSCRLIKVTLKVKDFLFIISLDDHLVQKSWLGSLRKCQE